MSSSKPDNSAPVSRRASRVALVALALPLGGCLEVATQPLNHEPTAYEDSVCNHVGAASPTVVNYGCVAGTELSLRD
jgi:hypothetical protein